MKKFFIIFVALIGMIINSKGQTLAEQLSLHVGMYQIGTFDAPDEIHSGTVINTCRGSGIMISTKVTLNMVVTSCNSNGDVAGYIDYYVPCVGLNFDHRAFYQSGHQRVVFTATKEGTSYVFDFTGNLKLFTSGQNYDFDVFDGEYMTSNDLFTSDNGTMYTILVLQKTSGTYSVKSKDRPAKFGLYTRRAFQ